MSSTPRKKSHSKKGRIKAKDHTLLSYQIIAPQKPQSYLLFLNGRSEWSEKYGDIHERLGIAPSCAVITWDHRGQGESEGEAGHIDNYKIFVSDAETIASSCIPPHTNYGLLAHSMGGLIALLGILNEKLRPEFIILSAPLLRLPNTPLKRPVARKIAHTMTHIGLGRLPVGISHDKVDFGQNTLTHSYHQFSRLVSNPRPHKSPSFGWLAATFKATEEVFNCEKLKKLSTPILVLGGSEEAVVDYHGFPCWVRKALGVVKTPVEYIKIHGARHELFNETPRLLHEVRNQIRIWIKKNNIPSSQFEIDGVGN